METLDVAPCHRGTLFKLKSVFFATKAVAINVIIQHRGIECYNKLINTFNSVRGVEMISKSSFQKTIITEFSLYLDPPPSSLRPWHGHRGRSDQ